MSLHSTTALVPALEVAWKPRSRHRAMVFAVLAVVIVLDQLTKWWAWRHASVAHINDGGNPLVGATIGGWYADPLTGALLDLLDVGLLSSAVAVLIRRRRPVMILITGALMTGGWISNLVDRLGLHYLTAPGSVRGAVDFIHLGDIYYNVADVFIAAGTVLFLLTAGVLAMSRSHPTGSGAPMAASRLRAKGWTSAIAGAVCVISVVGFGAVNYGGVTDSTASDRASNHSSA
jgi:lipoprotein signal peptidase